MKKGNERKKNKKQTRIKRRKKKNERLQIKKIEF